ncbi:MAG TPA: GNAT family N-acetyltransferase [Ktedonobacteraceae bacterium]
MIQAMAINTDLKEFLKKRASDHFYADPAWFDLITSLYGYTFIPLTTTDASGRVTGFLPLSSIQSPLTGRRLVSFPFSDSCPLLAEDEASANELVDQAISLARERRARYLELRTGQNEALARHTNLISANLYANWLVQLSPDPDVLYKRLHQGARRKIKKARGLGVQVRIAEQREDMREYYRLHLLTRTKKHGMPAQPLAYFLRLWDAFAPTGQIHLELAEYDGNVVAAHITAFYGKMARYMYGASDERFHNLGAGYLLTWESIAWASQHGYQQLDLGRTAYANPGLMQFKQSWGAVEEPCPYYYYPAIQGLAATPESSRKYQLITQCWRRLPLRVSAPLGGYLYGHLG